MFHSARLKLTGWYLLIIMLISICFSIAIFYILSHELENQYRRTTLRIQQRGIFISGPAMAPIIDPAEVEAAEDRLKLNLIYINMIILGVSSLSGYFLAGRTLGPIQQMMDEQDRFITDASHELRTPLTALRSEIEVNMRDKNLSLKEAKGLLESNLEEVVNLQTLSDSLLLLTQYQKNGTEIPFEEIFLEEAADEAKKKVLHLSQVKKIEITNKISKTKILGNKQSLVQLFVIFLDNAIKYSPQNSKIELSSHKLDHMIEALIKDQGIGIEEKDIPHLFDRFYRTDHSRAKTKAGGYGLGLSIAQKIMELHKGYIGVASKVGKGTTFKLLFPSKE